MRKFIPVKLTPSATLNREALGPEIVDTIKWFEGMLGEKVSLSNVQVRQGSEGAKRIQRAHAKWGKM